MHFNGFCKVLEGKLGWKIEPKSRQNKSKEGIAKMMEQNVSLGGPWGRESLDGPRRAQGSWDPLIDQFAPVRLKIKPRFPLRLRNGYSA